MKKLFHVYSFENLEVWQLAWRIVESWNCRTVESMNGKDE